MTAYTYKSLSSKRSVWMLQLEEFHPEKTSIIRCSLEEVTLDDPLLQYQALSYVWGEETPSSQILVYGEALAMTANLEDALQHLRTNRLYCCDRLCSCYSDDSDPVPLNYKFTSPSLLWIDAICINQKDLEERNHQVSLMREIYSRASQVVVWLGRASEYTVPAFRLLFGLADLFDWEYDAANDYISYVVRHEYFQGHWVALGELLKREWWSRAWVIQEVTLACKVVFVCGPYVVDGDRIFKATATFDSCLTYMDEVLEATALSGQPGNFFSFRHGMAYIRTLRILRFEKWERPYLPARHAFCDEVFTGLLIIAKNYRSTDKRDKVYSILGLSDELNCQQALRADCSRSVCDIYMETAKIIFEQSNCLEFLNLVERTRGIRRDNMGLPSWAPDWTVHSLENSALRGGKHPASWSADNPKPRAQTERFSFTSGSVARCNFDFDAKTITVKGFVVGSIRETHDRFVDVDPNIRFENVTRFGKRIGWIPPTASETFERHLYWLSWLGFKSAFPGTQVGRANKELHQLNISNAEGMHTSKCFEVSGEKISCLAFSDASIEPGDLVCALLGGNMPYVLRPKGASWLFIGQWQVVF